MPSGRRSVTAAAIFAKLSPEGGPDADPDAGARALSHSPGTPFSVLHRLKALSDLGHRVDLVTYPFGEDVVLPGLRIVRCARPPGVRSVPIGPSLRSRYASH
jgi:hypothetical protein